MSTLKEVWRLRNAAAVTLALTEDEMRRAVRSANADELAALIESFSPAQAAGPEWSRTFEPLVERLWSWCDDATIAVLGAAFKARGPAWTAVANALSPDNGTHIRAGLRQPSYARQPAFTVV